MKEATHEPKNTCQSESALEKRLLKAWEYLRKTDFDKAERHFQAVRQSAIKQNNRVVEAHTLNGLAGIRIHLGNYPETLECLQESLHLFEELEMMQDCAMVRSNISLVYMAQGLYEDAEQQQRYVLSLNEKIGTEENIVLSLSNIATCLVNQQRYAEAKPLFLEARRRLLARAGLTLFKQNIREADMDLGLAAVYFEEGNRRLGFRYAKRALVIGREIDNGEIQAGALLILGGYGKRKKHALLEEALRISQSVRTIKLTGDIHKELVSLHRKEGRWQLAFEHLAARLQIQEQILNPYTFQKLEQLRRKELTHALETAQRLREEAQQAAHQDSLTHLYNRRYIDMHLQQRFAEARREQKALVVALIDIDNFKKVNDTHSHAIGDQVLCEVARLLTQSLRGGDIVGRYGGEEFVTILEGLNPEDAVRIINRMRECIEQAPWGEIAEGLTVTISAGVCTDTTLSRYETMLQKADAMLYHAKHHGKNCVILDTSFDT
jgi:diguanylate cyclase (GGDEF)-like protein